MGRVVINDVIALCPQKAVYKKRPAIIDIYIKHRNKKRLVKK